MRIIFFGTSAFAAKILYYLIQRSFNIVAVVTQPDRPSGRHLHARYSPVKKIALEFTLPLLQPEKISTVEHAEVLKNYQSDLFLVVAYGEIIKKNLLEIPKLGAFNIHASLLPKYRGAAPIQRCLMDGEKQTGINIIEMTPQMDAGDVVASAAIPIGAETTFGELESQLCILACEVTVDFLNQLAEGKIIKIPQDIQQVTFAHKLSAEDEHIHWNKPAKVLHDLIRALSPRPGASCSIFIDKNEKRLKILQSRHVNAALSSLPGTLLFQKNKLIVACGKDALELLLVQLEGKKAMPAADFLKGMQKSFSFIEKN